MSSSSHSTTDKKLKELYALIDGIHVCMFTTRRTDGFLVSRPMEVQKHYEGVDLWFVTSIESEKLSELSSDNHCNLSFYKPSGDWVSVSGLARIIQDKARAQQLYSPEWKTIFPDLGDGVHNGSIDDPRIALIDVEVHSASYAKNPKAKPVVLIERAVKPHRPILQTETKCLSESELRSYSRTTLPQT